jgi:hypothetical protein
MPPVGVQGTLGLGVFEFRRSPGLGGPRELGLSHGRCRVWIRVGGDGVHEVYDPTTEKREGSGGKR